MSGLLPAGTVTLLLADVEGSTRLWETQPEEMATAIARFNQAVCDVIAAHHGVRPVEQGEGDSFVAAVRARVRCGGRARWSCSGRRWPRSGCASGCTPVRCSCAMRATTRVRRSTARLVARFGPRRPNGVVGRDRAAGHRLAPGRRLVDRSGTYPLRDLPRPERVVQLCHPDLLLTVPRFRSGHPKSVVSRHLPVQLTSFVGRDAQLTQLRELLAGRTGW